MVDKFVQTASVRDLTEAMTGLMNRGAGVPSLSLVQGPAGLGKTEATQWYAARKGGRYLVANALWTERWMLSDLYAALKGLKSADFSTKKRAYEECLRLMRGDSLPIFIDEADRIALRTGHLEALRDLSDRTGTPIVFVGTELVSLRLKQREQFASRISAEVSFRGLTVDEVKMVAADIYGLNLAEEPAAKLRVACDGYFRDLVVVLDHLGRAARASSTKSPDIGMVNAVAAKAIKRAA
jgi:DNA transposition AAA+ family ATPase